MTIINNPNEWTFLAAVFHYFPETEEYAENAEMILEHVLECNNSLDCIVLDAEQAKAICTKSGRYDRKGTCDHCGAAFNYGAAYTNKSGVTIIIGNVCATTHMQLSAHQVIDKKMRQAAKAARTKIAHAKRLEELEEPLKSAMLYNHSISRDIKSKWLRYGDISPNQINLLFKIKKQGEQRAIEAAKPVYKGFIGDIKDRMTFKTVTCIKEAGYYTEDYYGNTIFVSITTLLTTDNKLLIVKSSAWHACKGQVLTIKGTVKAHDEYKSDDQTVIQRVITVETIKEAA